MQFSRESLRLLCHGDKEASPGEHDSLLLLLLLRRIPITVLKHVLLHTTVAREIREARVSNSDCSIACAISAIYVVSRMITHMPYKQNCHENDKVSRGSDI